MSEYLRGTTQLGEPAEEHGISLAGMGIPPESMKAWNVLQSFFARGEVTPCHSRPEWTSNRRADKELAKRLCGDCPAKAACLEFATINKERGAIYGGKEF